MVIFDDKENEEKIEKKVRADLVLLKSYQSPKIYELGDMKKVTLNGGSETPDTGGFLDAQA